MSFWKRHFLKVRANPDGNIPKELLELRDEAIRRATYVNAAKRLGHDETLNDLVENLYKLEPGFYRLIVMRIGQDIPNVFIEPLEHPSEGYSLDSALPSRDISNPLR